MSVKQAARTNMTLVSVLIVYSWGFCFSFASLEQVTRGINKGENDDNED